MNRRLLRYACSAILWLPYATQPVHLSVLDNPNITTELYGYAKLDAFWDDQQMFAFRDAQFLVSPEPIDTPGRADAPNERGQFHFTVIESRLGMMVTDTQWYENIHATGRVEFDFFGVSDSTLATARLRHAYVEFCKEDDYAILLGQMWHPLFIPHCAPRTLGFDYGAPAEFQSRAAQMQFTKHHNNITYMCAALSQQDPFVSDGPNGFETEYIRNSMMPEFLWRIETSSDTSTIGTAASVKRLVPRIATDLGDPTDTSVTGANVEVYAGWDQDYFSLHTKIFYAQNPTEHSMLGGYGIIRRNPQTDERTYDTINVIGGWIDMQIPLRNNWYIGTLIAGVTKHDDRGFLVSDDITTRFGTLPRADSVLRVSPRIVWQYNNFETGLEVAIARTEFGTPDADTGDLANFFSETGIRTLFVSYYYF